MAQAKKRAAQPAKKKQPAMLRPIVLIPEDESEEIITGDGFFGGDVMRATFEQEVERISKQMENESVHGRDEKVTVYEIKVLRRATIRRNKVSVETETF